MNLTDYGRMLVTVGDRVETRPIDSVRPSDYGPPIYEPVLRPGEMAMHFIDGSTHIIKTGL